MGGGASTDIEDDDATIGVIIVGGIGAAFIWLFGALRAAWAPRSGVSIERKLESWPVFLVFPALPLFFALANMFDDERR